MSNRSNPFPGAPDAPDLIVQGEGVGRPKNTQRAYAPHGSTTPAQRQPGGRPVDAQDRRADS